MDRFLLRLERKLKDIPTAGSALSSVPVFVSMIKNYVSKEYTDAPIGTIIAIIAALLYFVSPVDIIPDVIPGVGLLDDAAVIGVCLSLVNSDLKEYEEWRRRTGRDLVL